jgi:hypothetical protein
MKSLKVDVPSRATVKQLPGNALPRFVVATMQQDTASLLPRHFHIRRRTFVYFFMNGPLNASVTIAKQGDVMQLLRLKNDLYQEFEHSQHPCRAAEATLWPQGTWRGASAQGVARRVSVDQSGSNILDDALPTGGRPLVK